MGIPTPQLQHAAELLRDFLNKHLSRGTGNDGEARTASAFAQKAGLSASRVSDWRRLKGGLPQLSSLQTLEWAFFPDRDQRANDPAFLEWQRVRRAIETHGSPRDSEPDQRNLSLRDAWALLTRPIIRNTIPIVRSAPNEPGAGVLRSAQITARVLDTGFVLPLPDSFHAALRDDQHLRERYDVHPPTDLSGDTSLAEFYDAVPVEGLRAIVAYHGEAYARFVLEQLRRRAAYPPYNKQKAGLHGYQQAQRSGRDEGVYLDLDFYRTDYHTHRVMKRVLHDIRLSHPALFADDTDLYDARPWLRYFTTSFGVNVLATTQEAEGKHFYMARLSNRQGNANQQGLWHVSANEGISMEDVSEGHIDIGIVVARALSEELGHAYDPAVDETLYLEFAIDQRNLEPFISCVAHLATDRDRFYRQKQHLARDDRREFHEVRDFPFAERDIIRVVLDNPDGTAGFTSYCLNILDSVLVRGMAE
jgi:hypothetical protein